MSDYQKQLEGYEILKAQLRRKLLLVKKLYGMSEAENKKVIRKQKEFLEKNKKIMEGSVDYMFKTTEQVSEEYQEIMQKEQEIESLGQENKEIAQQCVQLIDEYIAELQNFEENQKESKTEFDKSSDSHELSESRIRKRKVKNDQYLEDSSFKTRQSKFKK